ncbi:MAG: hypothetical protein LBE44_00920 [Microbacterium hominis]|jgi:primary-amine oxidase|nr:hypothetical protein [Microbacterium hominis]
MADCWSIGYEHRFGDGLRLQQAFLYARLGPDEHLYAHPLDFNAVVDTNNKKVLKIGASPPRNPPLILHKTDSLYLIVADFAPHCTNPSRPDELSGTTEPHSVEGDSLADSGRRRIAPQPERMDYLPDLIKAERAKHGEEWDVRRDIKPLQVIQPEGVSFEWVSSS